MSNDSGVLCPRKADIRTCSLGPLVSCLHKVTAGRGALAPKPQPLLLPQWRWSVPAEHRAVGEGPKTPSLACPPSESVRRMPDTGDAWPRMPDTRARTGSLPQSPPSAWNGLSRECAIGLFGRTMGKRRFGGHGGSASTSCDVTQYSKREHGGGPPVPHGAQGCLCRGGTSKLKSTR